MPVQAVTCPECKATLKPKTPIPEGTRIKCPKCATVFTVAAEAPAPKPAPPPRKPKPAPPPEETEDAEEAAPPADEEEVEEVVAADDEEEADDEADEEAEEGAAKKPKRKKKKGVPLWVWIASGVGALVVLCGCCPLGGWLGYTMMSGGSLLGPNVNMNAYKQLKKGMTEDEVKKVMGGAPTSQQDVAGLHHDIWKGSGEDFITVQFVKGKAVAGAYQFTEGPATMAAAGPLP